MIMDSVTHLECSLPHIDVLFDVAQTLLCVVDGRQDAEVKGQGVDRHALSPGMVLLNSCQETCDKSKSVNCDQLYKTYLSNM